MLGAIIGDVVGSVYEWNNIKTKDFELFKPNCFFTDDTVMTVAVAKALLETREKQSESRIKKRKFGAVMYEHKKVSFKEELIQQMQAFGRIFPDAGYGGMFRRWLESENPQPYNSFGNGSAMRVSPCGYIAVELDEALALAKASAEVTHNHPEGIKGAQAVAAAIFLARCGKTKDELKKYIEENFYSLDRTLDEIRPNYKFDVTCQGTVPPAIQAFLESTDFEDAIRNAISLGGDSDTLAAITGSIAWAYYRQFGTPISPDLQKIQEKVYTYLPQEFIDIYEQTDKVRWYRAGVYDRVGGCTPIYP